MATFNFPMHKVATENPETGFRGQFGGAYVFTTPPVDPDQRVFKLTFEALQFFFDLNGNLDATQNPTYNMKALIDFYIAHKLHVSFTYEHPVHGSVEVKFNKPLSEPEGTTGGMGVVEGVELEFIEVP